MDELTKNDNPFASLARAYLEALLEARREDASRLILDAAASGTGVKDLYLQVFQPVQREIGRLWQVNSVTVAQEYYCTAATQLIMGRLSPFLFTAPRNGKSAVVTCVAGDLHEVGARMGGSISQGEGWDAYQPRCKHAVEGHPVRCRRSPGTSSCRVGHHYLQRRDSPPSHPGRPTVHRRHPARKSW